MGTRKGAGGAGVQDNRVATRIGRWYASGPEDRTFVAGDPAFSILRVVSDDAEAPGCVTVENAAGQRFPVSASLIDAITAPAERQARDLLNQPIEQREHGA